MIEKTFLHFFAALCCIICDTDLQSAVDGRNHIGKIKYNRPYLDYEPLNPYYEYSMELNNAKRKSGIILNYGNAIMYSF